MGEEKIFLFTGRTIKTKGKTEEWCQRSFSERTGQSSIKGNMAVVIRRGPPRVREKGGENPLDSQKKNTQGVR